MAEIRIGIVGARSYTARELLVRLVDHPGARVTSLMARVEERVDLATMHPSLRGRLQIPVEPIDADHLSSVCELVFLCLPHGPAGEIAKRLVAAGTRVVDFSGDFRFEHRATYERAYRQTHPAPDLIGQAVYGLPELWRDQIRDASLVANPGCYSTAVILALAPFLRRFPDELPAAGVVADCKSGVSGAGRTAREHLQFCEANEGLSPYSVADHRHGPEIDAQLAAWGRRPIHVTLVPHLVPMERGVQRPHLLRAAYEAVGAVRLAAQPERCPWSQDGAQLVLERADVSPQALHQRARLRLVVRSLTVEAVTQRHRLNVPVVLFGVDHQHPLEG